jgi:flagellar protein FliS
MQSGDIPAKGKSISKAIAIIDNGLRASLDKRIGGEIALNLDSLYEYMSRQLLLANLNNDEAKITEVQNLLRDLKGAWEAISPEGAKIPPAHQHLSQHKPLRPDNDRGY